MTRIQFLRDLRHAAKTYGTENIVYFDESGFESHTYRPHGWAERGKKIYCDVQGKREKKTNLIMALRGKDYLAPILFQGSCESKTVLYWIKEHLLKELTKPSIIVMDNAPIHNKSKIAALLAEHGHILLSLPPYSPDFNPIENSFAHLKKRRQFLPEGTPLDALFIGNS